MWSFGVVLWELLTGNVPYRGVEEAAIVYGVGSNRLHLPVPEGVPDGFSLLLKQCFNFTPKHRPHFRQILLHLDILASDPTFTTPHPTYFAAQASWGQQIAVHFDELRKRNIELPEDAERVKYVAVLLCVHACRVNCCARCVVCGYCAVFHT